MTTPAEALNLLKEKEVKFVDLRFTDTRGKEQHLTIPAHTVDASFFEDGKMFDGSSIAGWKGIQESDMVLMPDASTIVLDPFMEDATVNLRCDVYEPSTMQGYTRCPRMTAKRAEAYLKSTGIADQAYFRSGKRVLHFRRCPLRLRSGRLVLPDRFRRGRAGIPARSTRTATRAIGPASRAATFPCRRWTPCRISARRCA